MQVCRLLVLCGLGLAGNCASIDPGAAAVTPFAIKATNVTMPSATVVKTTDGVTWMHMGSSEVTVTGIPDDGILTIKCWYSGPSTKAKIPKQCGPIGLPGRRVTPGQTAYGNVSFVPYDQGYVPGLSQLQRAPAASGDPAATVLVLAGVLMLGFGFRRKTLRWFVLTVIAVSALAGALKASVSGRKGTPMTPGTYQYTISANFKAIPDGPPEPTDAPLGSLFSDCLEDDRACRTSPRTSPHPAAEQNASTNITLTVK
jgi:hypothetical protein